MNNIMMIMNNIMILMILNTFVTEFHDKAQADGRLHKKASAFMSAERCANLILKAVGKCTREYQMGVCPFFCFEKILHSPLSFEFFLFGIEFKKNLFNSLKFFKNSFQFC